MRSPQAIRDDWFCSLPSVLPVEMVGLWRGEGVPSDHPLDGVLENLNWFGKRFHSNFAADALLFQWHPRRLVPIEPAHFPIGMTLRMAQFGRTRFARTRFSHMQKALRARGTTASLRLCEFNGKETAAMVYDRQPIIDYFRWIDGSEVAGMMVVEGDERRYFFRLRNVDPSRL